MWSLKTFIYKYRTRRATSLNRRYCFQNIFPGKTILATDIRQLTGRTLRYYYIYVYIYVQRRTPCVSWLSGVLNFRTRPSSFRTRHVFDGNSIGQMWDYVTKTWQINISIRFGKPPTTPLSADPFFARTFGFEYYYTGWIN